MNFQQIVAVTKQQPLKFKYEPDRKRQIRGLMWLIPDDTRIYERPALADFRYVAIAEDGTKYEWNQIVIDMYDGKAMTICFDSFGADFLESTTWASKMLVILTKKHGNPPVVNFDPSKLNINKISSGVELVVAKWEKGDYEICLGIAEYKSKYSALITYTHIPLRSRNEKDKDKDNVKPNF